MNYKEFFKDKKVAVIGLGPHGEMLTDIKFLLKNNALLSIFDIRSEKRIPDTFAALKELGLENIQMGKINFTDLSGFDLILLSPEISKKSLFLKGLVDSDVQIEYPETLFFKLAPAVTLVGVLGEHGKTTVTNLIQAALKKGFADYKDQGLFIMDPESANGALAHLKKIKKGDVLLAKIPEYLLPYLYQIRISPHVAVVISPISFDILEFQTYNNFIVAPDHVVDAMKEHKNFLSKAKILRTRGNTITLDWGVPNYPIYNHENLSLVLQTAELFKVPLDIIRQIAQNFTGLKGRLEFIKKVNNVEFYNDACSIGPTSTLAALKTLHQKDPIKNIILIVGGAYTGRDYSDLLKNIPEYVSAIILISGSGVIEIRKELEKREGLQIEKALSLEDAVIRSKEISKKGDRVLFSPAFEAVGVDISRKERSEKFVKAVRSL